SAVRRPSAHQPDLQDPGPSAIPASTADPGRWNDDVCGRRVVWRGDERPTPAHRGSAVIPVVSGFSRTRDTIHPFSSCSFFVFFVSFVFFVLAVGPPSQSS